MRITFAAGLLCAVYAVFGGVVWSAYEEFGNRSLLDRAPMVVAERTPFKLLPDETTRVGAPLLAGAGGNERSGATVLARRERPAPPLRESVAAAAPDGGGASEAARLTARPALAPFDREPVAALEAPATEMSAAAARAAAPLEVQAAASLASATPAAAAEVFEAGPAATWPLPPALKPLDAVPFMVAQVVLEAPNDSATEIARLGESPPLPSLKPIVMPSEQRPWPAAEQETRLLAASDPASLPDALRAFWANLKILLASGPAPRVVPAGGSNSDRWSDRSGGGGGFQNAGAGGGSGNKNSGGASKNSGDGSKNSGGGKGGAGSANAGDSAGGGGSAGGGVSGGGGGVSAGGPGSGGKGSGGKGSGGKSSGKGGKSGAKGDGGKGGKGDGGKGGGKGGRGGDDDDDD